MNTGTRGVDLAVPIGARDHVRGAARAPLTLVQYGDYECRDCGRAYSIVKAVRQRFGSKLRFVFRNFPITDLHPHAEVAAEVAEAAATHGKFWEMHDVLFENQHALGRQDLIAYITELGVDISISELRERVYLPRIVEDVTSGQESGLDGTPAFFINGARFEGTWDESNLVAALSADCPSYAWSRSAAEREQRDRERRHGHARRAFSIIAGLGRRQV
jgi:protein-disulfide isomerase